MRLNTLLLIPSFVAYLAELGYIEARSRIASAIFCLISGVIIFYLFYMFTDFLAYRDLMAACFAHATQSA